jgi:hypothetical protein
MKIGLNFRAELMGLPGGAWIVEQFDSLIARISGVWRVEHLDSGQHGHVNALSVTTDELITTQTSLNVSILRASSAVVIGSLQPSLPGVRLQQSADELYVYENDGTTKTKVYASRFDASLGFIGDTISERTAAAGVTVDGVLLKDGAVTTDTINEKTAAAGVTVDGVLLKDGGLSIAGALAASGQIVFPATQVPSANANTLDDYKEDSFTPTLRFGGATTGITYSTQNGVLVKIGRNVFFTGVVALTSKGSATGAATVAGLPGSNTEFRFANFFAFGLAAGSYNIGAYVSSGASPVVEMFNQITGTAVAITDAEISDTSTLYFGGWYQVTN